MLARVAENMYWMARYLERAENLARLIGVNANLVLDLPRRIAPTWRSLVTIVGDDAAFRARHGDDADEGRVLRFMVSDSGNASSIVNTLHFARENARTFRELVPREAWLEINRLYHYARDNAAQGISKRGRFEFLSEVITRSQTVSGIIDGTMSHGEAYTYLAVGRLIERADMTTRIVDVRSESLIGEDLTDLRPFDNIQWMSVLKSLTGYQMYRLEMQSRVRRTNVLRFLLQSETFPRSVRFCARRIGRRLDNIPNHDEPLRVVTRLLRTIGDAEMHTLSRQRLHEFIDELQIGLGAIHDAVAGCYFRVDTPLRVGQG